ncbi:MAG: hypothetical protein U0518_00375 [Candidatus Gracilibacteria bacterium]
MAMIPSIVVAGFVVEPTDPVYSTIADNVRMIEEIRANFHVTPDKDCTPFRVCQVIHGDKISFSKSEKDMSEGFVVNTEHSIGQRITVYDNNMNGVPNRIDGLQHDVSQIEGAYLWHDILVKIQAQKGSTVITTYTKD